MRYFERESQPSRERTGAITIHGITESDSTVVHYGHELRDIVGGVVATTAVECSEILNIPIPRIIILSEESYRFHKRRWKTTEFNMMSFTGGRDKAGKFLPSEVWINPIYFQKIQKGYARSELKGIEEEYNLSGDVAHEMYHFLVARRFPIRKAMRRKPEGSPTAFSLDVWWKDTEEYGADLFALGYIRSRTTESALEEKAREAAERKRDQRITWHRDARRGK